MNQLRPGYPPIPGPLNRIERAGGVIKSRQQVEITLSGNVYASVSRSATAEISPVDTANSICHLMTNPEAEQDPDNLHADAPYCICKFVDSDTVIMKDRWYQAVNNNVSRDYVFQVIEFEPSVIKSIQLIDEGFTVGNQTISAVDLSKSTLYQAGFDGWHSSASWNLKFINSTTVYADFCGWVVEFK